MDGAHDPEDGSIGFDGGCHAGRVRSAVQRSTVQCSTVQCSTVQRNAVRWKWDEIRRRECGVIAGGQKYAGVY